MSVELHHAKFITIVVQPKTWTTLQRLHRKPYLPASRSAVMIVKTSITEYTEHEFRALISAIEEADEEETKGELIVLFKKIVPHPAGSDLLYYPEDGADDSTDGVVQTIKDWCLDNNVSGFKATF